jgi:hypothetical protein
MKKTITNKELLQIRKKQAKKLEYLLTHPQTVDKIAKKMYPKSPECIYAGERHPKNKSLWRVN